MLCKNSKNNYSVFDFISPVIEILAIYMINKKLYIFFKLFFSKTSCLLVTRKKQKNWGEVGMRTRFFLSYVLGTKLLWEAKKRKNAYGAKQYLGDYPRLTRTLLNKQALRPLELDGLWLGFSCIPMGASYARTAVRLPIGCSLTNKDSPPRRMISPLLVSTSGI